MEPHPNVGKYVNAAAFIITGIAVGVSSFYNYGEKMANHFNTAVKYSDIASGIELELMRGRKFRSQIDVFSLKIHMLLDSLVNNAPILPKSIANKYSNITIKRPGQDSSRYNITEQSFHFTPEEV
jgi:hypothetical protein